MKMAAKPMKQTQKARKSKNAVKVCRSSYFIKVIARPRQNFASGS